MKDVGEGVKSIRHSNLTYRDNLFIGCFGDGPCQSSSTLHRDAPLASLIRAVLRRLTLRFTFGVPGEGSKRAGLTDLRLRKFMVQVPDTARAPSSLDVVGGVMGTTAWAGSASTALAGSGAFKS